MSDALDVYKEYIRMGRGRAEGGLVAASQDVLIMTAMVHRAHKMVKLLKVILDDVPQGKVATDEAKQTITRWLDDYNKIAGMDGGK